MTKGLYYTQIHICHHCEDRYLGCHSSCERYLSAKKKADEEKKRIQNVRAEEFMIGQSNNKIRKKEAIRRWYRKYGV